MLFDRTNFATGLLPAATAWYCIGLGLRPIVFGSFKPLQCWVLRSGVLLGGRVQRCQEEGQLVNDNGLKLHQCLTLSQGYFWPTPQQLCCLLLQLGCSALGLQWRRVSPVARRAF